MDQCIISLPPMQSSQTHSSHVPSPKLTESLTVYTDDDTNSPTAASKPNCSDANSAHSLSPSSNVISYSISFSYEKSQIGQFYMEQEAAKKSKKYDMRSFALVPDIPTDDEEEKDCDDDETMNRILINYCKQESLTKDQRRAITSRNVFSLLKSKKKSSSNKKSVITSTNTPPRAPPIHSLTTSADFSQSQVPLQTRIAQWREMTDKEDRLTPLSEAPIPIMIPKIQHFSSGPVNNQYMNEKPRPWNGMIVGSMTPEAGNRSSAISPKQSGSTISDFGFFKPEISSQDSDAEDNGFNDSFDSDKEQNEAEDDEKADILREAVIKTDRKQSELAIQKTTQLLMVSNRNSKDVFQSLWNVCISLKKDPEYHISFNDKLLKHDHVESFLRLLGFVKKYSSSQWSCFAHTRVETSLIDSAILECHKCRQIIQQRDSTLDLIRQHKKKKKSQLNLNPANSLSTLQPAQELSQTIEESHAISIDANDNGDSVQLYELIWGITHNNNNDPGAQDILLLCYPLVTNAKYILYCLQSRFFKDDHDGRVTLYDGKNKTKYDRILSSFSVQANVIALIRHWMVRFWDKDWDSDHKLMSYCKIFINRIRKAYQSEENQEYYEPLEIRRGLRLVEMLEKTIKTQKTHRQMRLSKIFGDSSGNHGLLISEHGHGGKQMRPKKRSSLFFRAPSIPKMNKGPKNLMDVSHVIIAEEITLYQFDLFKRIHPRECLKQAWKKKETKHKIAPNITQYIEAFNQLIKWVQSSILSMKDVKTRGRIIKRWVKVEEELLKLRNFEALCAVYAGLASTPIYRLKEAWSYVPKKHITQHEEIRVIMKSSGNWRNLRSLQLQTQPPMLPYFGMFAKDMIAIEETTNNRSNDGSINWDALCRGQAAIDKHLTYQDSPYKNLNTDLSIQRWMNRELTMSSKLDDEWIFKISDHVVLNDKRELGKGNKTKTPKKRLSLWKSK